MSGVLEGLFFILLCCWMTSMAVLSVGVTVELVLVWGRDVRGWWRRRRR